MTYAELLSALMGWIRKPEAEQEFPLFIQLLEAQLNRKLTEAGIVGATLRTAAAIDSEYETAPADMMVPIRLTLSTGQVVENITLESFTALKECSPTSTGKPRHYTVVGRDFRFLPAPDQAYPAELVYQAALTPLGPTVSTNWLSIEYPDVYLYGSLLHAGPWFDNEPRIEVWRAAYQSGLDELFKAERNKRGSRNMPGFRADLPFRRTTFNINTGY